MVTDDILKSGLLYISLDLRQMEKSLIHIGMSRCFPGRQHAVDLHGNLRGVNHFVFGFSRMNIEAVNRNSAPQALKFS